MSDDFQVLGTNAAALFTLKIHRGDGMALLAMNWKVGKPSNDFVGFAIDYREPHGSRFFPLKNRITFPGPGGAVNRNQLPTMLSPIQKFRWVHFPRNANLEGAFTYRVTPVFMNASRELSYGEAQEASIVLARETYPGKLNVTFTRGFVSSQAFVDRYVTATAYLCSLADKAMASSRDMLSTYLWRRATDCGQGVACKPYKAEEPHINTACELARSAFLLAQLQPALPHRPAKSGAVHHRVV